MKNTKPTHNTNTYTEVSAKLGLPFNKSQQRELVNGSVINSSANICYVITISFYIVVLFLSLEGKL